MVISIIMNSYGQKKPMRKDSLNSPRYLFKETIMGTSMILGGLMLKNIDNDFYKMRHVYTPNFRYKYDDYLQYAPAALLLGLKFSGVQGTSSWSRMLVADAFSGLLLGVGVNSLKSMTSVLRPDGSAANSFPSGHTALSFMTATLLHKEYGKVSKWYSIGGYTIAATVGLSRILNNKHWLSDVVTGAGIGILSAELGYYFTHLIFKEKGLLKNTPSITSFRNRTPSYIGLYFGIGQGRYTKFSDYTQMTSLGVEGAYFVSKLFGIGGRLDLSMLSANNKIIKVGNMHLGPFLSYPLTNYFRLGAKLLCGRTILRDENHLSESITDKNPSFIFGISLSYLLTESLGLHLSYDFSQQMSNTKGYHRLISLGTNILF